MIYSTWDKLYANDILVYRSNRFLRATIYEDEICCFYSTENGVRYYKVGEPEAPDKIPNYEIGKDALFSIHHILKNDNNTQIPIPNKNDTYTYRIYNNILWGNIADRL